MQGQNLKEKIIIIDFGSQVTKLIARRIRELGVFSEIITIDESLVQGHVLYLSIS